MFAGKLIEKKASARFPRALRRIRQKRTDVWGLIVGDGPLKAAVDDYRRGTISLARSQGFRTNGAFASTYAAADALVLPSTWGETWGLVVNEAMACGLPVIVSDQAGCAPDLVVEGETGFTYPCADVAALAACVDALAGDPRLRDRMSARASTHIAAFLSRGGRRGRRARDRTSSARIARSTACRRDIMSSMLNPAISRSRFFELTSEEWALLFAAALLSAAGSPRFHRT
jgi:glycosyltransferase involved in cell wall biosynthesis